jgi:hypothetical protein
MVVLYLLSLTSSTCTFIWKGISGEICKWVPKIEFDRLVDSSDQIRQALWKKKEVREEVHALGVDIGRLLIGSDTGKFLDLLTSKDGAPVLLAFSSNIPGNVIWESLVVPEQDGPLAVQPGRPPGVDVIRVDGVDALRMNRESRLKCLAVWCNSRQRPLMTEDQVELLRQRSKHHSFIALRQSTNPTADELRSRLRLECALFLFAGHGAMSGAVYEIYLRNGAPVAVTQLTAELDKSRAQVLVFDSCESGIGDVQTGLPKTFTQLKYADCLIAMQGPADDLISRAYVPECIEQILIGEPAWRAIGLVRRLVFGRGHDDWFVPVIYLKRNYRPLEVHENMKDYLESLRKPGAGQSS